MVEMDLHLDAGCCSCLRFKEFVCLFVFLPTVTCCSNEGETYIICILQQPLWNKFFLKGQFTFKAFSWKTLCTKLRQ